MKTPSCIVVVGALVLGLAMTAHGSFFVTTGQTGAQVQVDVNHTHHWTYSVGADVSDIAGGLFTMKRGSGTFADISFEIYEGDFGSPLGASLLSVTLTSASFTQSFNPIAFTNTPITLYAGHTYTAVLSSIAADVQSEAYFIKGGMDAPLFFTDSSGDPIVPQPGGGIVPGPYDPNSGGGSSPDPTAVPLPMALPVGLMFLGGLLARHRRAS